MGNPKKKGTDDENIILNHINQKKSVVCGLIDTLIEEIGNKERITNAPLNQLASVVGTLIDKFSVNEKASKSGGGDLVHIFEHFKDVK